jgi:hypothetical protein
MPKSHNRFAKIPNAMLCQNDYEHGHAGIETRHHIVKSAIHLYPREIEGDDIAATNVKRLGTQRSRGNMRRGNKKREK